MSYLCTYSPQGTWGRCLSAYPHFAGQFPNFSRCKALTITLHVPVVCRKRLGALPLGNKHASFRGLDSCPNLTLQSWSHHLHLEENIDFQPCPCTHIAPLSVLGRCVSSFWCMVDFYASTKRQRWNSKEMVLSDFLLEAGKCGAM